MNKGKIMGVGVNLDAFSGRRELEQSDVFGHLSVADRKTAIDEWAALKGWKSKQVPVETPTEKVEPVE